MRKEHTNLNLISEIQLSTTLRCITSGKCESVLWWARYRANVKNIVENMNSLLHLLVGLTLITLFIHSV